MSSFSLLLLIAPLHHLEVGALLVVAVSLWGFSFGGLVNVQLLERGAIPYRVERTTRSPDRSHQAGEGIHADVVKVQSSSPC